MLTHVSTEPEVGVAEAARILDCHDRTVRRMIYDGTLPARRVGKRLIRIKVADLEALGTEVKPTPSDPIREAALRVVSEAPQLSAEQLDRICALVRGVA